MTRSLPFGSGPRPTLTALSTPTLQQLQPASPRSNRQAPLRQSAISPPLRTHDAIRHIASGDPLPRQFSSHFLLSRDTRYWFRECSRTRTDHLVRDYTCHISFPGQMGTRADGSACTHQNMAVDVSNRRRRLGAKDAPWSELLGCSP